MKVLYKLVHDLGSVLSVIFGCTGCRKIPLGSKILIEVVEDLRVSYGI